MKVYTKLVWNLNTGELLEEESHEYSGPVALCKGGDNKIPETPEQRELATIAAEQWDRYQNDLKHVENKFMEVTRVSEGDKNQVAGQAAGSVMQGVGGQAQELTRQRMTNGGPSAGGSMVAGLADAAGAQAGAVAGTVTDANERSANQDVIAKQDFVAMGRGQAREAQFGLGEEAGRAADKAIGDAYNKFNTSASQGAALGMAAGAAGGYYANRNKKPAGEE